MFHVVLVGFLRMTRSVVFVPVLPYLSLSISVEHEHNFSSGPVCRVLEKQYQQLLLF